MNQLHPSRRQFIKWTGTSLAAIYLPACAEEGEPNVQPRDYVPPNRTPSPVDTGPEMMDSVEMSEITQEEVSAWEADGVLTPNYPGDWADKIVGHYPIVKQVGDQVSIVVPHAMDEDHYIEAIYLKNGSGDLVASKRLSAEDDYAFAEFTVASDALITAYSVCNLHQVWSAPAVRNLFKPGPWADKVIAHTPKVKIEGDQAVVSVPHPMNEDHYIVGIYITDQDDAVIGKVQLSAGDMPSYSFTLPEGTSEVQPWALCDDHDLWAGQSLSLEEDEYVYNYESTGVLNADEPGAWGDKIAGHYPLVSIDENMITVHVAHPMDADHYIEAIYLKDSDGHILGFMKLSPSDQAIAQFMVIDPNAEYYAYAMCNLHEVWSAPIVRSGDRPGPWADKVNSHTPTVELGPEGVTVTVQHPMDEEHYIAAIYLTAPNGEVIAKKQLNPQEYTEAQYTFELPPGVMAVKPWALCDDHDLWYGSTVTVG